MNRKSSSSLFEEEDDLPARPCKQLRVDAPSPSDDVEDEMLGSVWSVCNATGRLLDLVRLSSGHGIPIRLHPRLRKAASQLSEIVQACSDRETVQAGGDSKQCSGQADASNADVKQLEVASGDSPVQVTVLSLMQNSAEINGRQEDGKVEKKNHPKNIGKENNIGTKGPVQWCQEFRHSREFVTDWLHNLVSLKTEVVRYRDKASAELVYARVPTSVVALLQMRTRCDGKEVSDEKLARAAVDVMEAQAYDPLRAVASLCPASFLPPSVATNVLGSGHNGWVFFDPSSKTCLKVMLDDNGPHEYEIQHEFAEAGLAPRPISLEGPYEVPNPQFYGLYVMRMEVIDETLQGVLAKQAPCGPYSGLDAPDKVTAESLGKKLVAVLTQLRDRALVHGDLHMENIGVRGSGLDASVMVIDFSRSCTPPAPDRAIHKTGLDDGHAYDVFRLIVEMFDSFEELESGHTQYMKAPQKELRALEKQSGLSGELTEIQHEMHQIRQIASLRAYIAEQRSALEKTEQAYNSVLTAVVTYTSVKFSLSFEGAPSIRNRRLRQSCNKQCKDSCKAYFNSPLYWLGFKYEE